MADGELKLDDETTRRLEAAAEAAGRPVGDYAADLIAVGLQSDDWAEDLRIADEVDRTGVSYSVEEADAHFRAELRAQVARNR